MKRSRFTEEQIIGILREQEAGVPVADLCRKHGLSSPTFYKWKAKYGGMDVSEARRLKALEEENAKLKRMLADSMLDNVALKDLLGKWRQVSVRLTAPFARWRSARMMSPSALARFFIARTWASVAL